MFTLLNNPRAVDKVQGGVGRARLDSTSSEHQHSPSDPAVLPSSKASPIVRRAPVSVPLLKLRRAKDPFGSHSIAR